MKPKPEFTTDQTNDFLIETINKSLTEFCFGEHKGEMKYPISLSSSTIKVAANTYQFNMQVSAQKDANGIIKTLRINVFPVE